MGPYLTACFVSGSSARLLVEKLAAPASRNTTPRILTTGFVLCSTVREEDSVAPWKLLL